MLPSFVCSFYLPSPQLTPTGLKWWKQMKPKISHFGTARRHMLLQLRPQPMPCLCFWDKAVQTRTPSPTGWLVRETIMVPSSEPWWVWYLWRHWALHGGHLNRSLVVAWTALLWSLEVLHCGDLKRFVVFTWTASWWSLELLCSGHFKSHARVYTSAGKSCHVGTLLFLTVIKYGSANFLF